MIEWEYIVALVAILFGSLIFIIPLAAFALRFASKPLIEAFARYKEVQGGSPEQITVLRDRISLLEQRLDRLEGRTGQLAEGKSPRGALESPKG